MKTSWQKVFSGTCVAVLMFISVACGSNKVAADPTPDVTVTATPPTETVTQPPVTMTPTPTPAPTKTVTKTVTPTTKVTPTKPPATKKPKVPPKTSQVPVYPMPETADGDPGGASWDEVGLGSLRHKPKCNPNRDTIDLELNGIEEVRGSQITVTLTAKGVVIKTNSVLLATAFIMNEEAAGAIPEQWRDRAANPSKKTLLLPAASWNKAAHGPVTSLKVCAFSA